MFSQEYEYEITYKNSKNASEQYEKMISIDIEDYINSYADKAFILGQAYTNSIIEDTIYPSKKQFVQDIIHDQIGKKAFVSSININNLIKELDQDVESYLEEIDCRIEED